jgi:hypothetical protein
MSLYEGQSIKDSVNAQIVAAGMQKVTTADQEPELRVIVHSGGERQGDHILLPGHPDLRQLNTQEAANNCIKLIEESTIPCILCDVAYANGADPILTEMLLERPDLFSKIWGYAGWNTTGNAVGTALGMAMAKWFSMRWLGLAETVDKLYKQCLFIRLTDDWAYQARVRSMLKGPASPDVLQSLMKPYLERICQALNFYPEQFHLMHPWQRTFEIEVNMPVPEVATQK